MPDLTQGKVEVVSPDQWEAIALWLRQDPRGPELLDALAMAARNLPGEVVEQIAAAAARPDAPPALVTIVTGGYIGKLVQIARAHRRPREPGTGPAIPRQAVRESSQGHKLPEVLPEGSQELP